MNRYLPQSPFPPYAYVPGMHPHPVSDPQGHSYRSQTPQIETIGDLRNCGTFLRGIDLFNAGYYWEAHEAWEAIWLANKRAGKPSAGVHAVIKLAAAGVKARQGSTIGVARHAGRALQLLAVADALSLPLNLEALRQLARDAAARPEGLLNTAPAPVLVIFATTIDLSE